VKGRVAEERNHTLVAYLASFPSRYQHPAEGSSEDRALTVLVIASLAAVNSVNSGSTLAGDVANLGLVIGLNEELVVAHYASCCGKISYDVPCEGNDAVVQVRMKIPNLLQKTERCAHFSRPW